MDHDVDAETAAWVVLDDLRMEPTWEFNKSADGHPSEWYTLLDDRIPCFDGIFDGKFDRCKLLDGHLVRTDETTGLTDADADRAIQILTATQ